MARGPRKHLKRLFAPKDWMLSKLTGVFAPRPRAGPHKLRESMPLIVILRNRLKYALNARESDMITRQRLVLVDGRTRTDSKYPTGFQDVIEMPKSGDRFRLLYDQKGRFTLVPIGEAEANIKILKVERVWTATGRIPVITTHDGHRIRYPSLRTQRGDSVVYDFKAGKIRELIKLREDKVVMTTGGANRGRVGTVVSLERHPGAFDIAHLKDQAGHEFTTRLSNVFVIGNTYSDIPITLPKAKGVKESIIVEREAKLLAHEQKKAQAAQQKASGQRAKVPKGVRAKAARKAA